MLTLHHRAARDYAALSLPACPLLGKAPIYAGGHGWNDATTDRAALDRLFTSREHSGVGIACGKRANAWVLDIDGAAGLQSIRSLIRQHSELPRGPACKTGGGGYHLWFRWDDRCAALRNRVGFAAGLDIRTGGGGVVVPPSIHERSGRRYEWRIGRSPYDVAPPTAPDWLVEVIVGSYPAEPSTVTTDTKPVIFQDLYVEAAFKSAETKIETCIQSQRGTLWYAAKCIGKSLIANKRCRESDALKRLVQAGMKMENTKPRKWTKEEIEKVVADGLAAGECEGGASNAA